MQSEGLSFQGAGFGGLEDRVGAVSLCRLVHSRGQSFRIVEIPQFGYAGKLHTNFRIALITQVSGKAPIRSEKRPSGAKACTDLGFGRHG